MFKKVENHIIYWLVIFVTFPNVFSISDKQSNIDYYKYTQKDIINNPFVEVNINNINSTYTSNCTINNCPKFQGVCYEDVCYCAYGFVTHQIPQQPMIYCNYKQKIRATAFFLEFFFPFGAGHIYAGKITLAIIKFSLFLIFILGFCSEICLISFSNDKWLLCSGYIILFDLVLWGIIQLIDLFCYGFGYYLDGNRVVMI